jgi:hypothetical protein
VQGITVATARLNVRVEEQGRIHGQVAVKDAYLQGCEQRLNKE